MFAPNFRITPAITKALMAVEADRQAVAALPIDLAVLAGLRQTARLLATHYSTQIEGNRLTQAQVNEALAGAKFPGRERDQREVRHYYLALEAVEGLAARPDPLIENNVQTIHGLVMTGRPKPTPYRDGQNVIRNSGSNAIVYLPPEARDVPALMTDLVQWTNRQLAEEDGLPVPLTAAIAHYQFATIHPYYDGNGRTARLLTTLILHKTGYGLKGIYALEEYYARDLPRYYQALTVGPSHNYYGGREKADVTEFLAYFCEGMAQAFSAVRARATDAASRGAQDQTALLRQLDPRQRRLLELFRRHGTATAAEMAKHLGISHRTVVQYCRKWVASGFLVLRDPSRKNRLYQLAQAYEKLVAEAATPQKA